MPYYIKRERENIFIIRNTFHNAFLMTLFVSLCANSNINEEKRNTHAQKEEEHEEKENKIGKSLFFFHRGSNSTL